MNSALCTVGLAASLLSPSLLAQLDPGQRVALTETPATGASLIAVDTATGRLAPLGWIGPEPALAVVADPIDRGLVVAFADAGSGSRSRLERFTVRAGGLAQPRILGHLPGRVEALAIAGPTATSGPSLVAITSGPNSALWRMPRNGGAARQLFQFSSGQATALWLPRFSTYGWVALSRSTLDPQIVSFDIGTGPNPPVTVPGLANRRITGIADLPTGAIRHVLTDDRGDIHLFEFLSSVRTLTLNPPLPPGATNAMRIESSTSIDAVVLGDSASPVLRRIPVFGTGVGTWQTVSQPLPGAPVDFDLELTSGPGFLPFGDLCAGPTSPTVSITGLPRLGTTFTFELANAWPAVSAIAVFGFSDQFLSGPTLPLPLTIPGICGELAVSAEVSTTTSTGPRGNAAVPINVPNQATLIGLQVFGQWVAIAGSSGIAMSNAASLRVDR